MSKSIVLTCCGHSELGTIDRLLNGENKPEMLIVADTKESSLERAKKMFPIDYAVERGVLLMYVDTSDQKNTEEYLFDLSDGTGFDDVYVFETIRYSMDMAKKILSENGEIHYFCKES